MSRAATTIRGRLPWLLLAAIVAAVVLLWHGAMNKKAALRQAREAATHAAPPVNVVVQRLVPDPMEDRIDLPAQVRAWNQVMVKAQVNGVITRVLVKEGDHVREGTPLATIDDRPYRAAVDALDAKHQLAINNLKRMDSLADPDAVARVQYDQAKALMHELMARVTAARLDLEHCTITAPFAGVVNTLPAVKGMLLAPGDPVARIVDTSRLKVVVPVPESDAAAVRRVKGAMVRLPAAGDISFPAPVRFMATRPEDRSMTYELQLTVDTPPQTILPGMFARVTIVKQRLERALAIPLYAVITEDKARYVFVVKDGIAHQQPVTTGFIEDWRVRVTQGLAAGDQVVIVGQRGLAPGQEVRVIKTVTDPGEIRR